MKTKPKASEPMMLLPPARSAKAKTKAAMQAATNRRIWNRATKAVALPTAARVVSEQAVGPPQGDGKRGGIEPRSARVSVPTKATARPRRK